MVARKSPIIRGVRILFALVALACAVPAYSHHSFAAFYFESQSVTIEGDIEQFDYAAPHAWVHVLARDERGQVQRFSAEWANPTRLERDGFTRDTLRAGDHVIITGAPGREASERKIHLKKIQRTDRGGWSWEGRRR